VAVRIGVVPRHVDRYRKRQKGPCKVVIGGGGGDHDGDPGRGGDRGVDVRERGLKRVGGRGARGPRLGDRARRPARRGGGGGRRHGQRARGQLVVAVGVGVVLQDADGDRVAGVGIGEVVVGRRPVYHHGHVSRPQGRSRTVLNRVSKGIGAGKALCRCVGDL